MNRTWVLVTGASSGIGRAIAGLLVDRGHSVFAGVRTPEAARVLQDSLGTACMPLLMDVRDGRSIRAAAGEAAAVLAGATLAGVVNNAGVALGGPLEYLDPEDFRTQMEVNLTGPFLVSQAFLPLLYQGTGLHGPGAGKAGMLRAGRPGRIVNISSVSGAVAYPFLGPYAISKHGLEALTDVLRRELMVRGVDVISVAPGNVATPIWDKAAAIPLEPSRDTPYAPAMEKTLALALSGGRAGMDPAVIARVVCRALFVRRPRARYVPTRNFLLSWVIPRLLPKRLLDRIMAGMLGLRT